MKIVHIVPVLHGGGAQYFMYRLLQRLAPRYQSEVISLHNIGLIGELVRKLGIPVMALGMARGAIDIPRMLQLREMLKKSKPDIVHTWMHHADLIGGLAARSVGIRNIIWEIQGDLEKEYTKLSTRLVGSACAMVSHSVPKYIISCAYVSRDNHIKMGYAADKIDVIPNGCDTTAFKSDAAARAKFRREFELTDDTFAVGMMARFHEQKRQQDFLDIARIVLQKKPNARFFMGGRDVEITNATLMNWITERGLEPHVVVLGRRDDMYNVLNGLDTLVSPSFGEGFPLLVGEAMSCALPCVATAVGDTGYLVGDAGVTTAAGDILGMAAGVEKILSLSAPERQALGMRARQRVIDNFELSNMIRKYEELYDRVATGLNQAASVHLATSA